MKLRTRLLTLLLGAIIPFLLTISIVYWQTSEVLAFKVAASRTELELLNLTTFRAKVRDRLLITYEVLLGFDRARSLEQLKAAENEINKSIERLRVLYGEVQASPAQASISLYADLDQVLDQVGGFLELRDFENAKQLLLTTRRELFVGKFIPEITRAISLLEARSRSDSQIFATKLAYIKWLVVGLFLLGLLVSGFIAAFLFLNLVKRLKEMEIATEAIGVGRLDVVLNVKGSDELAALAKTFNIMVTQVKLHQEVIKGQASDLVQSQAQLFETAKLSTLGEMSAGMAHEMNQPLAGISLAVDLIRKLNEKKLLSEVELDTALKEITTSIERCNRVIKHVREFSRQGNLEFGPLSVNETMQSALMLMGAQLKLRGIQIVTDLHEGLRPVNGDPFQLEQVWINALANARDALDELAIELVDEERP
ncbi:histidine kinase dimerization/phospho-acceptor domain-containing protein, partial [Bdellovibrionota bacterium FG-2]